MRRFLLAFCLLAQGPAWSAEAPPSASPAPEPAAAAPAPVKIHPKNETGPAENRALLEPDTDLIDAPTSAVLDYGGYSTLTRFFSSGGLLERATFGVFNRLNIGAALDIDRMIGNLKPTRVRAPNVEVKYRFFDGDRLIPSLAAGFDGQGYNYSEFTHRYNHRQRGFYVVATQEVGIPGLLVHPSFNISDFGTNSIFGAIPVSYNIRDRVNLMLEWDNIANWADSRLNAGARFYITGGLHVDFAVRGLAQGGSFSDGSPRGPERVVQIKYSANF